MDGGSRTDARSRHDRDRAARTTSVEVRGRHVAPFLDGQQWGSFTDDKRPSRSARSSRATTATGELIVKVVNAQSAAARTAIDLGGAPVRSKARVTTLSAPPDAVNTETATPVAPVTSSVGWGRRRFSYTFPANSVTFLRIRER